MTDSNKLFILNIIFLTLGTSAIYAIEENQQKEFNSEDQENRQLYPPYYQDSQPFSQYENVYQQPLTNSNTLVQKFQDPSAPPSSSPQYFSYPSQDLTFNSDLPTTLTSLLEKVGQNLEGVNLIIPEDQRDEEELNFMVKLGSPVTTRKIKNIFVKRKSNSLENINTALVFENNGGDDCNWSEEDTNEDQFNSPQVTRRKIDPDDTLEITENKKENNSRHSTILEKQVEIVEILAYAAAFHVYGIMFYSGFSDLAEMLGYFS